MLECDSDSDSDVELNYCQSQYCPGICEKDLTQDYFDMFDDVKDLLRAFRAIRRQKGFVPRRPLLLVSARINKPSRRQFFWGE